MKYSSGACEDCGNFDSVTRDDDAITDDDDDDDDDVLPGFKFTGPGPPTATTADDDDDDDGGGDVDDDVHRGVGENRGASDDDDIDAVDDFWLVEEIDVTMDVE